MIVDHSASHVSWFGTICDPVWEPVPSHEALGSIEDMLGERFSTRSPIRVEVQAASGGYWRICTWDR
jgi:hypothetical protein